MDLKADRKSSLLLVQAAHLEENADGVNVAQALAQELRELASWLGLAAIRVERQGAFAPQLRKAVQQSSLHSD